MPDLRLSRAPPPPLQAPCSLPVCSYRSVQRRTGAREDNSTRRRQSDVPMAQFIVNLNASMPASDKFILHMLDPTHMFVQPHVAEMIRSKISEFRDQNSYEKPT
uniref:General transcription and DNA repair factor IIH subunit TFB5 n=1 Tax=Oryza meridionalis TaxID=40149 RepID=A0A0E0EDF2_9ORYZ